MMRPFLCMMVLCCVNALAWAQADSVDNRGWEIEAEGYFYFTPEEGNFIMPIIRAETGMLHLETRYNYEEYRTASVWGGPIFSFEGNVEGYVTPMFGVGFGSTSGLGPGLEAEVSWKALNFYVEGEYFYDLVDKNNSFVYHWLELSAALTPWLRAGAVSQRTRLIHTTGDVSLGGFIGAEWKIVDVRLHVFDPGSTGRYWVLSLAVTI